MVNMTKDELKAADAVQDRGAAAARDGARGAADAERRAGDRSWHAAPGHAHTVSGPASAGSEGPRNARPFHLAAAWEPSAAANVPAKPHMWQFQDRRNGTHRRPVLRASATGGGAVKRDWMRKRWMTNINELLARLASPYRPERHYMRGGKSRDLTARVTPRRGLTFEPRPPRFPAGA